MDRQEMKSRAARAVQRMRERRVASPGADAPDAVVTRPPPRASTTPPISNRDAIKHGQPCGQRTRWRDLPARAKSMLKVLASKIVPDEVYESRNEKCAACPHMTLHPDGRMYCLCCSCPQVRYASLNKVKNRRAAWECPRSDPAFGAWNLDE